MKTLKAILAQGVDLIFLIVTLGLWIWYLIDSDKNFTLFLAVIVGYISFNLINKVLMYLEKEQR